MRMVYNEEQVNKTNKARKNSCFSFSEFAVKEQHLSQD